MKILFICPEFLPSIGGIISHVHNISIRLQENQDLKLQVLTSDFNNKYTPYDTIDGINIVRLRFPGISRLRWLWSFLLIPKTITFLKNNHFDIIHVYSYTNFGPVSVYLFKCIFNPKKTTLIFTPLYHPHSSNSIRHIFRRAFDFVLRERIFQAFSSVIALTNNEKFVLSEFCENAKIIVIPTGVDPNEISHISHQPFQDFLKKGEGFHFILYTGYLLEYKGVHVLIRAFDKIKNIDPSLHLVIIGDGDHRQTLENLCENLELQQRVHFLGFVDRTILISAMHNCDFLILPSQYETFGIVLVEAMTCKKPVISTNVGGIQDIGIDPEFLIPFNDVEILSDKIRFLLENPKVRNINGEKNSIIASRYTWEKIVNEHERIYTDIQKKIKMDYP